VKGRSHSLNLSAFASGLSAPAAKEQNTLGRQTVGQGSAARRAAVLALSPNVSLV
jgi:hypothetical protein